MALKNAFDAIALDSSVQTGNTRLSSIQQLVQSIQRIAQLLKPLGVVSSTNRLNIDINSGTVTTVTTVTTMSNQTQIGAVNAFAQVHDISRMGYNNAIRGKIS